MSKTRRLILLMTLPAIILLGSSCVSQGSSNSFYDAGAQDLSVTGKQMSQYVLYRFETSGGSHSLNLPQASDIISQIGSPTVGQIFIIAVTVEGTNPVMVTGGNGVIIKPSAATVPGNVTKNLYFVVTSTNSNGQTITVY